MGTNSLGTRSTPSCNGPPTSANYYDKSTKNAKKRDFFTENGAKKSTYGHRAEMKLDTHLASKNLR